MVKILPQPTLRLRLGGQVTPVILSWGQVFGEGCRTPDAEYLNLEIEVGRITYLIGRNGSGKSRVANILAGTDGAVRLSSDRLVALLGTQSNNLGTTLNTGSFEGVPATNSNDHMNLQMKVSGIAFDEFRALRSEPGVALRVAAFIRRTLKRNVRVVARNGFVDPVVEGSEGSYSLFREEGHGLRELVILLAVLYRENWSTLIVDEPELHMHPSLVRIWHAELRRVCREQGKSAVLVTHEPSLIKPENLDDLGCIWIFQEGKRPQRLLDHVRVGEVDTIVATLADRPEIVSRLAFSPRPVLVEGVHDEGALRVAMHRKHSSEAVEQTDLIVCGGVTQAVAWFEIAKSLGLNVAAVVDLDALFTRYCLGVIGRLDDVRDQYAAKLGAEPASTSVVLRPLFDRMNRAGVSKEPNERARWLAEMPDDKPGDTMRKNAILEIWKSVGIWLHPQGRIEDVLGIERKALSSVESAAQSSGSIDDVADWCVYQVDKTADLRALLQDYVEEIALDLARAIGLNPTLQATRTLGENPQADASVVSVEPLGSGKHRITVVGIDEFLGFWVDVDRDTAPSQLILQPPRSSSPE